MVVEEDVLVGAEAGAGEEVYVSAFLRLVIVISVCFCRVAWVLL